jgi:type IV pilus assembly protein PilO
MKKDKLSKDALQPLVDNIEKLSKVQRILIFIVTIALMGGSFWYFSWRPKNDEINKLDKQLAALKKKLSKVKKQAQNKAKFKEQYEQAQRDFILVQQRLPKTNEIPELLANISKSGQESGLDFVLFKPGKEVRKEFYAEIPVSIRVIGMYHQIGLFFDRVSRLERVVNIRNITLKSQSKGNRGGKLNASCTAVTYKFIEAEKKQEKKATGRPRFNRPAKK